MKRLIFPALFLSAFALTAQNAKRPDNWFNLDPIADSVNGVSSERAYKELLKDKSSTTVIVGVIDSGVDFEHEDLKNVMWVNPGEIAGNGIDDDKNGYIDDIHGWNFIGGKDGRNVDKDNLEMTRVVRRDKTKYYGKAEADFSSREEKQQLKDFQAAWDEYSKKKTADSTMLAKYSNMEKNVTALNTKVKATLGVDTVRLAQLEKYSTTDKTELSTIEIAKKNFAYNPDMSLADLAELVKPAIEHYSNSVDFQLNTEFDPRSIVGDDYNNSSERYYGNADCKGPDSFHGTHVAGIIAASRNNGIGMDGIASNVRIMSVRCVPDGDERDKDVANAIRYATDNGAKIINMSFGKKYSWDKKAVDDAVKYAQSKGVLLIHAAGNDGANIDEEVHYPAKKFADKGEAENFMDVGALSWKRNDKIVAPFSNYGKKTVDIFSPGVDIYSTTPENTYRDASGTSMAAPVTAGVAAVLKSYYPTLTPAQIKKILVKSSIKSHKSDKVIKPGTKDELVKFEKLSKNAGIVNMYEAIKMAEKYAKTRT